MVILRVDIGSIVDFFSEIYCLVETVMLKIQVLKKIMRIIILLIFHLLLAELGLVDKVKIVRRVIMQRETGQLAV